MRPGRGHLSLGTPEHPAEPPEEKRAHAERAQGDRDGDGTPSRSLRGRKLGGHCRDDRVYPGLGSGAVSWIVEELPVAPCELWERLSSEAILKQSFVHPVVIPRRESAFPQRFERRMVSRDHASLISGHDAAFHSYRIAIPRSRTRRPVMSKYAARS